MNYDLRRVGDICRRHGVFVASDEIHADLQIPGSRHVPFASLGRDFAQNAATFWSASKAFNLAGLQCAAVICANDALRSFRNYHSPWHRVCLSRAIETKYFLSCRIL